MRKRIDYRYLLNTEIAMSVGNISSHFVRQWVEHAVMWVYRW